MFYPVDEVQTTLVKLELVANSFIYIRTKANGKIDYMDVTEEGNKVNLKVILVNTDEI